MRDSPRVLQSLRLENKSLESLARQRGSQSALRWSSSRKGSAFIANTMHNRINSHPTKYPMSKYVQSRINYWQDMSRETQEQVLAKKSASENNPLSHIINWVEGKGLTDHVSDVLKWSCMGEMNKTLPSIEPEKLQPNCALKSVSEPLTFPRIEGPKLFTRGPKDEDITAIKLTTSHFEKDFFGRWRSESDCKMRLRDDDDLYDISGDLEKVSRASLEYKTVQIHDRLKENSPSCHRCLTTSVSRARVTTSKMNGRQTPASTESDSKNAATSSSTQATNESKIVPTVSKPCFDGGLDSSRSPEIQRSRIVVNAKHALLQESEKVDRYEFARSSMAVNKPSLTSSRAFDKNDVITAETRDYSTMSLEPYQSSATKKNKEKSRRKLKSEKSLANIQIYSDSADTKIAVAKVRNFFSEPQSEPHAVVFHHPANEECLSYYEVHQSCLRALKYRGEGNLLSLKYEPLNTILSTNGLNDRWILYLSDISTCHHLIEHGLVIKDRYIACESYDKVLAHDYEKFLRLQDIKSRKAKQDFKTSRMRLKIL